MNKYFFKSFGSFNKRNEQIDSEKDSNKFEQESHERAPQYRARRAFVLIKLKRCYLFFK